MDIGTCLCVCAITLWKILDGVALVQKYMANQPRWKCHIVSPSDVETTATKQWFVAHVYLRMIVSLCTSSCVSSLIKHILPEWPNNNHTHMPKETTRNQISQATYCTLKLKYSALFLPSNYIRDPGSNSVNFRWLSSPKAQGSHEGECIHCAGDALLHWSWHIFSGVRLPTKENSSWLACKCANIYIYVYIHYMYV